MKRVALGEICDIKGGKRLPKGKKYVNSETQHAYLRVCDFANGSIVDNDLRYISEDTHKKISRYTISDEDVYISIAGTIGLVGLVPPHLSGANLTENAAKIVIHDSTILDKRYLAMYLSTAGQTEINNRKKATSQPKLALFRIAGIPIPLPPLAEQKRIAGILDAADALRAKRRDSLAQLDTLLQSTFLDMFGDPVTNPMGWEVNSFESWLDNIDSGWSPKCLERNAEDDEWGVLKLGAVTWCDFDETEQKALPLNLLPRPKIEVKQGDLLFSRKNTYELVAAVAYVHSVRPKLMLSDLIFRLRLKPEAKVESKFLWQLLIEPHQRQTIQQLAGGAAGSMPNISKTKLKTVKLIKPPIELQYRFATIVESIEQQKARMRAHLAELDTLFASLQSRAFNGEL